MRIVGGRWGGRRLVAPRGTATRPTADMAREALFNALFDVEGWRVLDLYAGTGAVALEALSRGAAAAVCVEKARHALAALAENAAALGAGTALVVRAQPVATALAALAREGARFDLIFADPPYDLAQDALPAVLAAAAGLLADGGVVVLEHRRSDPAPAAPAGLVMTKSRRHGEAAMSWYAAPEE
ncbi:MAG: 16S rRNA (guanine(966)-N(2))-methyltransferase RsmD [Myxococcales bacterium]|nr:16S rRNA (guanine(966)-N(2))-methyltransferase RsmD [Myxococcales bacterium]